MEKLFGKIKMTGDNADKQVRDLSWGVSMEILDQLKKPGLTSSERESLCDELQRHLASNRSWEERNSDYYIKKGTAIGCVGGIGLSAVSILAAMAIKAIKLSLHF